METKYKVGDTVIVTNRKYGHCFPIGREITLIKYFKLGDYWEGEIGEEGFSSFLMESEFKLKQNMDNVVIKSKKKGDGQKIVKLFESWGVDTGHLDGDAYAENKDMFIYYGIINKKFDHFTLEQVEQANATILRLPKEKKVKYPKSIEDVPAIIYDLEDVKIAYKDYPFLRGLKAIGELKILMHECNKIDSGTTEFEINEKRYCICNSDEDEIRLYRSYYKNPLQFKKELTGDWFLKQHKELIQTAKDFI